MIALDPWFWPHVKDSIGSAAHQKTLIVMTERFPGAVKADIRSGNMDTYE